MSGRIDSRPPRPDSGTTTPAAVPGSVLRRPFVWAAIAALFLDQATKIVVHGMYRSGAFEHAASLRLLGDVLRVAYERNPQGVFGLRYGPPFIYLLLPLVGAGLVAWYGLKSRSNWLATAHGLILGGALGNVIDRVRVGYVIDFIVVEIKALRFRWYTWNLADGFVVVGIIMLLAAELFRRPRPAGEGGDAPGLSR